MIQDILVAIQGVMQADTNLSGITKYNLVDGMLQGLKTAVSIGCGKIKYDDKDNAYDEAHAPVRIYVYTQDTNAERGEETIRNLTKEIRYTILESYDLAGLVDEMRVTDITFDTEAVNQQQMLHYAMIELDVKYYEPRRRPADVVTGPPLAEIDSTLNSETTQMIY